MVLGLGKKKKENGKLSYGEEMALTEQSRRPPMDEDMIYTLGRSVYMIMDPEVTALFTKKNSKFKTLLPAFSHLNRVSKIGPREAELLELDYEYLTIIHKLNMEEEEFESQTWQELEALKIFARHMINDAFNGWKGNLITEQIKTIRTEIQEKPRRRWPF